MDKAAAPTAFLSSMRPDGRWRRSVAIVRRLGSVRIAVAFGVIVAVLSEGLGTFDAFARGPLVAAWLVVALAAATLVLVASRRAGDLPAAPVEVPRDRAAAFTVGLIAAIILIGLVTALLSPPSNSDVLSYHMPRVRHWIQNRSFAHYPTNSIRQLSFPPGAGYFVAQLQLLSGGDRFASIPQWSAFVGCVWVTGRLARRLFGSAAVTTAAVACATVPMAVLQATQPQSDLMASFWFVVFVWLVFERRRYRPADVVWLGMALGLGLATKPTVLVFIPPFVVVLAMRAARSGWRSAVLVPIAVVALALLPCLPNSVRNHRTFGTILGPDLGISLAHHQPRVVVSNVLRNVALSYPSIALWEGIAWVHARILHLDVNDPTTTHPRTHAGAVYEPRVAHEYLIPDENLAASPLHVSIALAGAGAVLLAARRRRRWAASRVQLSVGLGLSFLLFCGAVRWQPWGNRLLLPLVVLATPLVGWTLAKATPLLRTTLVGLLGMIAILFSLNSSRHPYFPLPQKPSLTLLRETRTDLYFAEYELHDQGDVVRGRYATTLREAEADGCFRLALVAEEHDPEYLLWITFDRAAKPVQIRSENVTNPSRFAAAEAPDSHPCGEVEMTRSGWGRYASRAR